MSSSFFTQPGWTTGHFNGHKYKYLSIKPTDPAKHVFLLLHTYPTGPLEFATVVPLLVTKGYGVIVPELLGYGETDKPTDLKAYARKSIANSLAALVHHEKVEKVIVVGHDIGSILGSRFAQWHHGITVGLVLAGLGHLTPRPAALDVDEHHEKNKHINQDERLGHLKFLVTPEAPKLMQQHFDSVFSITYAAPGQWKDKLYRTGAFEKAISEDFIATPAETWLTDEWKRDLEAYMKTNGFEGPVMWFRSLLSNVHAEHEKDLDARLHVPYLFLQPENDEVSHAALNAKQQELCDDITVKNLQTGHWMFQEKPQATVDAILAWVEAKKL